MYPTDGYVNGRRSNYPYGPVRRDQGVKYVSSNGGALGECATEANMPAAQLCFEPADAWKGELARASLYMALAYANAGWTCCTNEAVTNGLPNDVYLAILLGWHAGHPVSDIEVARNQLIFSNYQKNRNPLIDHPEWAVLAWPSSELWS